MADGGEPDWETLYYFYGDEQITPEEYDSYLIDGDYCYIVLGKSQEEIMDELMEIRQE